MKNLQISLLDSGLNGMTGQLLDSLVLIYLEVMFTLKRLIIVEPLELDIMEDLEQIVVLLI